MIDYNVIGKLATGIYTHVVIPSFTSVFMFILKTKIKTVYGIVIGSVIFSIVY